MRIFIAGLLSKICTIVFVLVVGCHSQKYTPADLNVRQLIFGNGGGFTGKVTQYILLESGQLFVNNLITQETIETRKISRQSAKQLFKRARNIKWSKHNFDHPGNIYYFVRLKEDRMLQEAIWGSTQHQVPKEIQQLYDQLLIIVSAD
jgi:hypothetical protein